MKIWKKILSTGMAASISAALSGCLSGSCCCDNVAPTDHLQIGMANRNIAPDGPVPVTGQFYLRISQGKFTPVIAQAMAITKQNEAVIFVSADMVSVNKVVLKKVHDFLKAEAPAIPAQKIIINATHTHAGPSSNTVSADYPHQVEFISSEKMQHFIARQITDAIKEAWAKRAPGSIAYGYGFAATGLSRRTIFLDDTGKRLGSIAGNTVNGKGRMYGNTADPMFEGYEAGTDPFINILYTFDNAGKLSGAIINVPCPAQTGENLWHLHASFWHNVREKLTEKYGNIGIVAQSSAAGDLAPRQLHFREAEKRRFRLKYADKISEYMKNPMSYPNEWWDNDPQARKLQAEADVIEVMRAEDIACRIVTAFDEVLSWAQQDKMCSPHFKHEVKTVKLSRFKLSGEQLRQARQDHEDVMKQNYIESDDKWTQLRTNSILHSRRTRVDRVASLYAEQEKDPALATDIHVVRIGNLAFATNRFELFIDYMHRIQGRSPFEQTVIVQLVTDLNGQGSYLATEKAIANKGYSATAYSNRVSPQGGQELVNATLDMLEKIKEEEK